MTAPDYARLLFGDGAVHVPAWLYVQDAGDGTVSFVGSSRVESGTAHPLRYGSTRTHQLIVGELLIRPHVVTATDLLRGHGLGGLITGDVHDIALAGDVLRGDPTTLGWKRS